METELKNKDAEFFYVESSDEDKVEHEDVYMFSLDNSVELPKYNVKVNGVVILMLIDSVLNLINEHAYKLLNDPECLCTSNLIIFAYQSKTLLPQKVKFWAKVKYKSRCVDTTFHVISGQGLSILSKQISEALDLLRVGPPNVEKTVNSVCLSEQSKSGNLQRAIDKYQYLFHGVGCYEGLKLKMHIDKSIVPVQQQIHRIPY